jgi:hypothetical protein
MVKILLVSVSVVLLIGCTKRYPDITWDYSTERITGINYEKLDSIHLDIYLDATTSMEGFAATAPSNYGKFIDLLETQGLIVWSKSNINYNKFGSFVKPIDRDEFLSARNSLNFYKDRSTAPDTREMLFLKTYMGKVVEKTNNERLGVLITDLFEADRDLRLSVRQIQENCFNRGINVGILGMTSAFNGTVFDVPQYPSGYHLNSDSRPFYAILFGNPNNMDYLIDALSISEIVDKEKFIFFSNNIIKKFSVSVEKTRESRFVNRRAPREKVDNVFEFSMKEKGDKARFKLEIQFEKYHGVPQINTDALELTVNKKSINKNNQEIAYNENNKDLTIEDIELEGNKLTASLLLKNTDIKGNYSYEVLLGLNELNGFNVPNWVSDFSTNNPVPGTPSASLTYNFKEFTNKLQRAQASVEQIEIANFYIHIFKL